MKLQVAVVLVCLIGSIWIQQALCDELAATSGQNNWTWTCSLSNEGNQTYVKSNCATSCDCNPAAEGSIEGRWKCTCAADGLPKIASGSLDFTCFTACNCTFGTLVEAQPKRKHFYSEAVVIVLLLCVVLTTLVFLVSVACYVYRKDNCRLQSPILTSDRETSYNSAANLISRKASLVSESRVRVLSRAFLFVKEQFRYYTRHHSAVFVL